MSKNSSSAGLPFPDLVSSRKLMLTKTTATASRVNCSPSGRHAIINRPVQSFLTATDLPSEQLRCPSAREGLVFRQALRVFPVYRQSAGTSHPSRAQLLSRPLLFLFRPIPCVGLAQPYHQPAHLRS